MHNLQLLCQMWANSLGGVLPYVTSEKSKITYLLGLLTSSVKREIIGTLVVALLIKPIAFLTALLVAVAVLGSQDT